MFKKNIQKWFCEINGHKLLSRNDTFININVDLKKVIYLTNVLIFDVHIYFDYL